MSEPLTANLRVFVQMSDGRIGSYAWNEIPSAERLRDELEAAGRMASDDDEFIYRPAEDWPDCVRQVFSETGSWAHPPRATATGQGALL